MLTEEQLKEIREHLERAQNPVFFFDNDNDGLCSFLLLRRHCGKGRGVAIKSYPSLDKEYFRKVEEFNADYIFILDKPLVSQEFLEKVEQINIPVVWIDHHEVNEKIPKFVNYYNPVLNEERKNEPTTYLCYKVTQKKEDLWLAVLGCVSDKFLPEFYFDFKKEYPDLLIDSDDVFDISFKSRLGKLADILSFALKDRTTNVVNMLRFLMKVKTPYEIFEENSKNYSMHKRYNEVYAKYKKFLDKAKQIGNSSERVLFFTYGGDLSISSDIANELSYLFPKKMVLVVYLSGIKANISVRGEGARNFLLKAIEGLENARGGGHENACGGTFRIEDLDKFKENFIKVVENRNI